MFEERFMDAGYQAEDAAEQSLRPKTLRDYIGQNAVKDSLSIYIQAALSRRDALDHILLYGPPGLGKTTLANIVAAEMGSNIRITSGPAIERPGDLLSIITNLNQGDVLFIDEIHRLSRTAEEVLYSAMEDFAVDIVTGKGPMANSIHMAVPKFTLVGATTRAGQLSAPLRDRFGILFRLEMYTPQELAKIVGRSATILGVQADDEGILEIARRSRGVITLEIAREAIAMQGVDELGLDKTDRTMLTTMMDKFGGGPVGLDTLAATTGEDAITIEDVYEPYLMQLGFLMRTPRGRICTPAAWQHMGRTQPGAAAGDAQIKMEL